MAIYLADPPKDMLTEDRRDAMIRLLLAIDLLGTETVLDVIADAETFGTEQLRAWVSNILRCKKTTTETRSI